jgi:hypothetical protein
MLSKEEQDEEAYRALMEEMGQTYVKNPKINFQNAKIGTFRNECFENGKISGS